MELVGIGIKRVIRYASNISRAKRSEEKHLSFDDFSEFGNFMTNYFFVLNFFQPEA